MHMPGISWFSGPSPQTISLFIRRRILIESSSAHICNTIMKWIESRLIPTADEPPPCVVRKQPAGRPHSSRHKGRTKTLRDLARPPPQPASLATTLNYVYLVVGQSNMAVIKLNARSVLQLAVVAMSVVPTGMAEIAVAGCIKPLFDYLDCDPKGVLNVLTNPRIRWAGGTITGNAANNVKTDASAETVKACTDQIPAGAPGETYSYFEMAAMDTTNKYRLFVTGMIGADVSTGRDIQLCGDPRVANNDLHNCKCTHLN